MAADTVVLGDEGNPVMRVHEGDCADDNGDDGEDFEADNDVVHLGRQVGAAHDEPGSKERNQYRGQIDPFSAGNDVTVIQYG